MEKRILLCALLSCALMLTMLAACDDSGATTEQTPALPDEGADSPVEVVQEEPKVYTIDFTDGKTDFLYINTGSAYTDPDTAIAIEDADGGKAIKVTTPNGENSRIGINVDGLLGSAVADIKTIVVDVYAEFPDGKFNTVAGEISAMSGEPDSFSRKAWSITSENRNPLQVVFEVGGEGFGAGPNIIEFACTKNGPAEKGDTPAVVYVKSISFFDSSDSGLAVDTSAGWAAPENYGARLVEKIWELPVDGPVIADNYYYLYCFGMNGAETVGVDDYMPWDIIAASYAIVFETERPELPLVFIYNSEFNNWGWQQNDDQYYSYEDGKLTVMWEDTFFDTSVLTEENHAIQLRFNHWDDEIIFHQGLSAAYLLYRVLE